MNDERLDLIERILAGRRAGRNVAPLLELLGAVDAAARSEVEGALIAEDALLGAIPPYDDAIGDREPGRTLGAYRLLRLLGRGGQGSIWLAEDERLRRKVALKVLEHVGPVTEERLARFRREAEVTSRLDHPGICPIYEAGRVGATAWLAMRYVPGQSVAHVELPASLDRRLEIVEQAARALHVAHEAGVIHRDVKPANLMLTPAGEVVVLDFGLAGDLVSHEETLTRAGSSFGTPAYSSPEQVRSGGHALDRRSDVWSLGVVLYELVTGKRPFSGTNLDELYLAILHESPRDPRQLVPGLSDDLCIVIAKALAKSPDDRYASALALAEDLQRVRTRRPIHARPATIAMRLRRWVEREPRLAAALGSGFVTLAAGLVVTAALLRQSRNALRSSRAATALAQAQLLAARDPTAALRLALADADAVPRTLANDALLKILDRLLLVREFNGGGGPVLRCDMSPDDSLVLSSSVSGGVRVFRADSGELVRHLDRAPAGGVPVLFVRGGAEVVTGGVDGAIRRFELATGVEVANFEADEESITCLARWPGRDAIAVGCASGSVALFELAYGTPILRFDELGSPVTGLALDGSGDSLVACTRGGRALLFDLQSGELTYEIMQNRAAPLPAPPANSIAITPDGATAFIGCEDASVWVWSVQRDGGMQAYGLAQRHDSSVEAVACSPSGDRFASASIDRTVQITDYPMTMMRDLVDHSATAAVRALAFAHDGSHILSASDDGVLRMLRAGRLPQLSVFLGAAPGVLLSARFSLDGRWIATGSRGLGCKLWSTATGNLVRQFVDDHGNDFGGYFVFRPDSSAVAFLTSKGAIRLVEPETGAEIVRFAPPVGLTLPIGLEFDPTGRRLLVAGSTGEAFLFKIADSTCTSLRALPPYHATGTVSRVSFNTTGDRVATVDREDARDVVVVSSTATGARIATVRGAWTGVHSLVFAPPGDRLLIACDDGRARVIDATSNEVLLELTGHEGVVQSAEYDPDARRIVTAGSDGDARLFDAETGRSLLTLSGHEDLLYSARFSSDGSKVVTAGWDGIAIVWDASTGDRLQTQDAHDQPVLSAEFSPDGRTVLTAGVDGTARLWPTDALSLARGIATR